MFDEEMRLEKREDRSDDGRWTIRDITARSWRVGIAALMSP